MNKTLRHLELFSGIGGFRKAIDLFCEDSNIEAKCVGFSEFDKYALNTYKSNFDVSDELEIGDIERFTSNVNNIKKIKDFDLLTGGFPCQPFSMMGAKKGFDDNRGNVFYSIINILRIKQPKYVLLENVRNLRTHDKGNTILEIYRSLQEDAGYLVFHDVFNTADFGLPQTRRRLFIFAIRKDLIVKGKEFDFSSKNVKDDLSELIGSTRLNKYKNVLDGILERKVDQKYYLSERIKPTILANGSKNFKSKSEINQLIARPLTATMVKMHRACQDNYYSDNFLNCKNPEDYLNSKIPKEEEAKHKIRKLTPLEAFRLQGFEDQFCQNAQLSGVSNHQLYKQAGNAVSVNTVYVILYYLFNKNIIKI
jgi:DNA (cytosine-5)-methyltransferase 1